MLNKTISAVFRTFFFLNVYEIKINKTALKYIKNFFLQSTSFPPEYINNII